jgi:hypothetical protein
MLCSERRPRTVYILTESLLACARLQSMSVTHTWLMCINKVKFGHPDSSFMSDMVWNRKPSKVRCRLCFRPLSPALPPWLGRQSFARHNEANHAKVKPAYLLPFETFHLKLLLLTQWENCLRIGTLLIESFVELRQAKIVIVKAELLSEASGEMTVKDHSRQINTLEKLRCIHYYTEVHPFAYFADLRTSSCSEYTPHRTVFKA